MVSVTIECEMLIRGPVWPPILVLALTAAIFAAKLGGIFMAPPPEAIGTPLTPAFNAPAAAVA
jgi:hypothetical protein